MKGLKYAGGSVPGTDHTMPGKPGWKNNQDAFGWHSQDGCLVAVACDGCGDSPHSEVGAQLAARFAPRVVARVFDSRVHADWARLEVPTNAMGLVQTDILNRIAGTAEVMSGNRYGSAFAEVVRDYFLFTMVGVVMTPKRTFIFSAGDGVYAVNGETVVIPPFEKNEPPYIAYGLVPTSINRALLGFQIREKVRTEDVSSIMLGSDGVAHLIAAADQHLPGKEKLVGPISQFWTKDLFVENPDAIRRHLALVNLETVDRSGEVPRIKQGLLPDDTTLVVIRRKEEEATNA